MFKPQHCCFWGSSILPHSDRASVLTSSEKKNFGVSQHSAGSIVTSSRSSHFWESFWKRKTYHDFDWKKTYWSAHKYGKHKENLHLITRMTTENCLKVEMSFYTENKSLKQVLSGNVSSFPTSSRFSRSEFTNRGDDELEKTIARFYNLWQGHRNIHI